MIRADGLAAYDGWPTSPRIEALRAAWLDAGNLDKQRQAGRLWHRGAYSGGKSATDSGMKSATDSDLISAIPI